MTNLPRSASGAMTVASYCFPKNWPANREQRARIIGEFANRGELSG
jgi:hypothetical protein